MIKRTFLLFCSFTAHFCCVTSFPEYSAIQQNEDGTIESTIQYETRYYWQPVDHFAFVKDDHFQHRYLYADQFWKPGKGPIFFYAGNEGDIEWFCNNTGLMWNWAPDFDALLVFAEHRYYGKSMPYGNDSFKDSTHVGYLTSEQALADFAELLLNLKATVPGASDMPIIAFGGSYGGMLAAWFRMKYPHVVQGSLAASAPIWQFGNLVPTGVFNNIVTNDFKNAGPNCADNIHASWEVITRVGATAAGEEKLCKWLKLCNISTADDIKSWLSGIYGNLAMVEYPYAANFLQPLPAWPIKEACKSLAMESPSDEELMLGLQGLLNVYFNYTGLSTCFNSKQEATSDLGDKGWYYQACTEMVMPSSADEDSMFEPSPWDLHSFSKDCQQKWHVTPRPNWVLVEYGGKNITASSNIIFSNGLLDPWSGGGVMKSLSDTLVAIIIEEGAHHLDLRSPHVDDPVSVIRARKMEKKIITGWIKDYHNGKRETSVPELSVNVMKVQESEQEDISAHDAHTPHEHHYSHRSLTLVIFAALMAGVVGLFILTSIRKRRRSDVSSSYFLLPDENTQT